MHRSPATAGFAATALFIVCFASCGKSGDSYLRGGAAMALRMEQVAAETDAVAGACRAGGAAGVMGRLDALQGDMEKIGFEFRSVMPPPEHAARHAAMARGVASEATGLSALRGYCERAGKIPSGRPQAGEAEKEGEGPGKDLQKDMEGQWKYFTDNHQFFKAHLRIFSAAAREGK